MGRARPSEICSECRARKPSSGVPFLNRVSRFFFDGFEGLGSEGLGLLGYRVRL